jgi:hypothetical protein
MRILSTVEQKGSLLQVEIATRPRLEGHIDEGYRAEERRLVVPDCDYGDSTGNRQDAFEDTAAKQGAADTDVLRREQAGQWIHQLTAYGRQDRALDLPRIGFNVENESGRLRERRLGVDADGWIGEMPQRITHVCGDARLADIPESYKRRLSPSVPAPLGAYRTNAGNAGGYRLKILQ